MVAEFGFSCSQYSCLGLTPLMEINFKSIGRAYAITTKTLLIMGVACCKL